MRVHDLRDAELDLWAAWAAGACDARVTDGVCMLAGAQYRPSSDWKDGGRIIEREQISVWRYPDLDAWHAAMQFDVPRDGFLTLSHYYQGPSPLVAAMRCFIAARFGDEISPDAVH